ncbi:hypothetical protein CROQUDRAFT_81546 [Cronartium quercuum f. sp. fusiforme G11]|uniref:MMS19 nucleotide excision repair protein n=1 Tax=Cronartium quercuum f. sp. fusiforme G11 TaxID=708437 RepID=A0A9P6T8V5_9BASI|nr:hypothetical protein CROQUDRAFT_81546 [Cronartium quercuum f. sp. fusiforme G11]
MNQIKSTGNHLVSVYLDEPSQKNLDQLVQAYLNRTRDLIQALGPNLTSEDEQTRSRAIKLLSNFLQHSLTTPSLKSNEIKLFVEFLVNKLADHPIIVIEALPGLRALTLSDHFGPDETTRCCRAIFENLSNHELNQPGRLQVLVLIDHLLAKQRSALKQMGNEFIGSYCTLVEGEKDPRNLLVAFRLAKVILTEFDVASKIEELFDITFCYFPITFRPPPGNPDAYGGITTNDLAQGLIDCLAATPRFAILALPLLLDKLQSPNLGPKTQVLQTIDKAFPVYGQYAVAEFASLYWESFANEIFQPAELDPELLTLVEKAFQTFICTLFPPSSINPHAPPGPIEFLDQILDMTLHELSNPEKSKAVPAALVVSWIITCGATSEIVSHTTERSIGVLIKAWKESSNGGGEEQMRKRSSILSHLYKFFTAISSFKTLENTGTKIVQQQETKDELLAIFISASLETGTVVVSAAIRALVAMTGVVGFLEVQEISNLVETATRVWASATEPETRDAALSALSILADLTPSDISTITLPTLFARLPSANPFPTPDSIPSTTYVPTLEALATLCGRQALFENFLIKILNRLEYSSSSASRTENPENDLQYAHHLFITLYIVLKNKKGLLQNPEKILTRLCRIFISVDEILGIEEGEIIGASDGRESISVRERSVIKTDTQLITDAGLIVGLIVRQLNSSQQQIFVDKLHACYEIGQIDKLLDVKSSSLRTFKPFSTNAPESDKNMVVLYAEGLIPIRADVIVPGEVLSTTESFVFKYFRHIRDMGASEKLLAFKAGLRLLCSTVNRRSPDFPKFFGEELETFWNSEIELGPLSQHQPRMLAIEIWAWIAKGLVIRGDQRGYVLLDRLCGLWTEEGGGGREVAVLVGILVEEAEEVKSFAVVKVLWKQRVCGYLLDKLVKGYHQRNHGDKTVYLIGLASLLAHVPPALIMPNLSKVIQLLLDSLELPEPDLKTNVLKTIHALVGEEEGAKAIEPHLPTLIHALLTNSRLGSGSSEAVRLGSVKILDALLTSFTPEILWAERAKVLGALGEVVDDGRRAVRRAGVDCRTKWFGLKVL